MKPPASQVVRCRGCGEVLCAVSPDGLQLIVRCRHGHDTRFTVLAKLGVIEPPAPGESA